MKSFSVIAFAALFLVAAVSAAPQRTPYPTIKEVIYELTSIFRCVPNVVGKTIGEGDFKPEYKEFKEYFGNVLEKLPECQDLQSLNQRYNCVYNSIRKFDNVFVGLIDKVAMKNKAMAEKIQTDLKDKCTKSTSTILKEFECNTVALEKASVMNGLTNEWKKFEQRFENHLGAWKQCLYPFCVMREISYVYTTSILYVETVANNPNFPKFVKDMEDLTRKCL